METTEIRSIETVDGHYKANGSMAWMVSYSFASKSYFPKWTKVDAGYFAQPVNYWHDKGLCEEMCSKMNKKNKIVYMVSAEKRKEFTLKNSATVEYIDQQMSFSEKDGMMDVKIIKHIPQEVINEYIKNGYSVSEGKYPDGQVFTKISWKE